MQHATLVNSITFKVNTGDFTFENGITPWANIGDGEMEIVELIDANEVVIDAKEVELVIDYPLANAISINLQSETGFTRANLLVEISKKYHQIYQEEEQAIAEKSKGKYGIFGHDIFELDLVSIDVYKTDNGTLKLLLHIDS